MKAEGQLGLANSNDITQTEQSWIFLQPGMGACFAPCPKPDLHHIILVYDKVPQSGHLAPWDLRVPLASLRGNVSGGFAYNLDAPKYGILTLEVFFKLIP